MDLVVLADAFAAAAHAAVGQVRKYDKQPYINHPREVRLILLEFATDGVTPEQEAAALLHDVVEDTGVTIELVQGTFGDGVADLVSDLTDVSKPEDGNRKARKQKDLEHTASASTRAKSIKACDLISNTRSIVQHDPDFARVYLKEKRNLLAVMSDADPGILKLAYETLNEAERTLQLSK